MMECVLQCGNTFQIELELESGNVGFCGEGKTRVPGEKPLGARTRTNNKFNAHVTPSPDQPIRVKNAAYHTYQLVHAKPCSVPSCGQNYLSGQKLSAYRGQDME